MHFNIHTQEHQKDQRGNTLSEQLFQEWTRDTFSKHMWVEEARKIENKGQEKQ